MSKISFQFPQESFQLIIQKAVYLGNELKQYREGTEWLVNISSSLSRLKKLDPASFSPGD